jgi:hypothetical protein
MIPPSGPIYADALTDDASGVVRWSGVTVIGEIGSPLSKSCDDDTADGAGATGLSLVEQLTSSRAANIGRRRRWRIRRVVSGRGEWYEKPRGPGGETAHDSAIA